MHRWMMENVHKFKIELENIWIDLIRGIYAPYNPASYNIAVMCSAMVLFACSATPFCWGRFLTMFNFWETSVSYAPRSGAVSWDRRTLWVQKQGAGSHRWSRDGREIVKTNRHGETSSWELSPTQSQIRSCWERLAIVDGNGMIFITGSETGSLGAGLITMPITPSALQARYSNEDFPHISTTV